MLLGSVEIIGNPLNFYRKVKTGIEDFYIKPLQGL